MKTQLESSTRLLGGPVIRTYLFVPLAMFVLSDCNLFAADEFQKLVRLVPRSANAIVLLNVEKAKDSPMGLREDWKANIEKAFEAGMIRVPPQATRFVLASQIDLEFMEPLWEAAIVDLDEEISIEQIAKRRGGVLDTIEDLPALVLSNDTYLVQFGPKTLGAMGPANRQTVVRWIRDVRKPSSSSLSAYLRQAAVFSDDTGSQIIMAVDLGGAMSFERIGKYLKSKQKRLDEWNANLLELTKLLCNVRGVRIGVRIGEQPSARIVIDLQDDASGIASFAKPLVIQIMSDLGLSINDVQSWTAQAKGSELSLSGRLTNSGLRRLLSVVDSPVSNVNTGAKAQPISPGKLPAIRAKASRDHFRAVVRMFSDLKGDMRDSKTLASASLWFDKYARRIERLPMLNVDEEVLNYSGFVAGQMRQASQTVKTMGIRSGARTAQITSSNAGPYAVGTTRWGRYGRYGGYGGASSYGVYGGYGVDGQRAEMKNVEAQRRTIRAQEKGVAATDVGQIRQGVIAATTDIRREMTQKYQLQF